MSEQSPTSRQIWLGPAIVWLALLLLLAASVSSAYVPLGPLNSPINLVIAAIKVGLIVVFFMHLRRSTALLRLVAASSALWVIVMFTLTFSDYLSRP